MEAYLTSFVVATVASALLVPVARRIAFKYDIVAAPGGRHVHRRAIPRLGGLAIFGACLATLVAILVFTGVLGSLAAADVRLGIGLLLGGTLAFAVGFVDDVKGIRALYKLQLQIVAAVIAWGFGFRIDGVSLPLLGSFSMGVFSLPVTVFWIVGIINAVNLIDGLDGLAAGVVFFAAITNFAVAVIMGTTFVAIVMATIAGAVLGFLFYNFNPARIFMGDSGSYFLGYALAICSIAGPLQKTAAVSIVVPIVALGVPIVDTLLAMLRRIIERRPIFSPDRGHIHHRLLDMGITHRRAVLIIYGVTVALCVAAIGIAFGRNWQVGAAILGVSVLLFGLVRFIGYFEYLAVISRQRQRLRSRHVERLRRVVLRVGAELDRARNEHEVLERFAWFAREAKLDRVALYARKKATAGTELSAWSGTDVPNEQLRDASSTDFPLGQHHFVEFVWRSELQDVSPQMDILLQVVLDQFEAHLDRVESALVRVPAERVEAEPAARRRASSSA